MKPKRRPGLTSVQIRPELEKDMKNLIKQGMTKTQIINEALRQFLIDQEFKAIRAKLVPYAQTKGIYTDEDVFKMLKEDRK